MEYVYYLEGLGCPNCAAKIERVLSKHKELEEVNLVFMKKKLIIKTKGEMEDSLFEDIIKIVKEIENHVEIVPYDACNFDTGVCKCESQVCMDHHKNHHDGEDNEVVSSGTLQHNHKDGTDKKRAEVMHTIWISVGIALFVAALLLDKLSLVKDWIYLLFYIISYILIAYDVLLQFIKNIRKGRIFDEFFLMSVATIGAILIGEYQEAIAVMLFYKLGEYFQDRAVYQAKGSIEALINIKPDFANVVMEDGTVVKKKPEQVKLGDIIEVKAGERIPLDGSVVQGATSLNMSALTGETKMVDVSEGEIVLSGSINITKYIRINVEKTFKDSAVSRIMEMVENAADKKSKTEKFITRFSRVYTPTVCFLAVLIAVVPMLSGSGEWSKWLYNALSFLVVSCPCALVISVPLGFFGGIGVASKNGILLKGGNYLEALADVSVIAFDKTGTLTKGSFHVSKIFVKKAGMEEVRNLIDKKGMQFEKDILQMDEEKLLLYFFALAEKKTNHPIGKSIVETYADAISMDKIESFEEISGYGLVVETIYGKIILGNEKMMKKYDISYERQESASTIIYGAIENIFIGSVIVSDQIKEDAREGIMALEKEGIRHTVLLSGDQNACVEEIAEEIGIEKYRGELLPGDKLEQIEEIYQENPNRKIAYVGDGINDAPVLARVDVGIAMGGVGQDAAIEAADMILMTDEISKIAKAIAISKYTRQIVIENILFALGVKIFVLILIAIGYSTMWMAVFADVGAALIAVGNSIRVYKHKF